MEALPGLVFWIAYMKEQMFTTIIPEKLNVLNWMMILMVWMVGTGRFTIVKKCCFLYSIKCFDLYLLIILIFGSFHLFLSMMV
jgi:hypothetical protein